jgi:hypothetical protein
MPTGTLSIQRTNDDPSAVARVDLYGPRGGDIGSTLISERNAREAINRLESFIGPSSKPASKLETLIDAAEAVLDSECGAISLGELAKALHDISGRDYRAEYPYVTPVM